MKVVKLLWKALPPPVCVAMGERSWLCRQPELQEYRQAEGGRLIHRVGRGPVSLEVSFQALNRMRGGPGGRTGLHPGRIPTVENPVDGLGFLRVH